jgi:hypothetical protein
MGGRVPGHEARLTPCRKRAILRHAEQSEESPTLPFSWYDFGIEGHRPAPCER